MYYTYFIPAKKEKKSVPGFFEHMHLGSHTTTMEVPEGFQLNEPALYYSKGYSSSQIQKEENEPKTAGAETNPR